MKDFLAFNLNGKNTILLLNMGHRATFFTHTNLKSLHYFEDYTLESLHAKFQPNLMIIK